MMNKEEWYELTQKLHGSNAQFFKPKENQVIQDFIETAKADKEFWEAIGKAGVTGGER